MIVSDNTMAIVNARLQLDVFTWSTSFNSIYSTNISVTTIPALSAISIPLGNTFDSLYSPSLDRIYRVQLFDSNGLALAPERVQLPESFVNINPNQFGDVRIDTVTQSVNHSIDFVYLIGLFSFGQNLVVSLTSTSIAPFVWLQADSIRGWFSDNAFTMTSATKLVTFQDWYGNTSVDALKNDIHVVSLKSWY
jgi:hypothetical protein